MPAASAVRLGQPGKKSRHRKKTRANGSDGHGVVRQLVGDAAQQQKAEQIDRLDQELLDLAAANLAGDARGQPRHAGKGPGHHRQQVVGDEIFVRDSRPAARCRGPERRRTTEKSA